MSHRIAHILRRTAQALRFVADQIDPPTVSFTTKRGEGFSEATAALADIISAQVVGKGIEPGDGRIARY